MQSAGSPEPPRRPRFSSGRFGAWRWSRSWLLLLGIAMLVNFERIDAWQQRRFPDVRSTPTRWQGGVRQCSEYRFSLARSSTRT